MADAKQPRDAASTDLAHTRTDWAEDRTMLAYERRLAGWMRIGMGCIGGALGLEALFGNGDHAIIAKCVAFAFVVTAIVIFWTAVAKSDRINKKFDNHDAATQSHKTITLLAGVLTLGAFLVGGILLFL